MDTSPQPTFLIGPIPVFGNQILAPMDGYTDQPFRLFIRQIGSSLSISEFINGIDIVRGHPRLNQKISFTEMERPFGYQILDDNIERIVKSALFLQEHNPDFLDINLGCPSKPIVHRGAGAALLKDPQKIDEIFFRLSKETHLPLTAKIRLGWDHSTKNYLEVVKILEQNGVKAISIHARTRKQGYSGIADWDAIAEVKNQVKIPVIGNGDIRQVSDIRRMLLHTNCDAVMIGRISISNPWIFMGLDRLQVEKTLLLTSLTRLVDLLLAFYGSELGLKLLRKFLVHILEPLNLSREQRIELFEITEKETLFAALSDLIPETIFEK